MTNNLIMKKDVVLQAVQLYLDSMPIEETCPTQEPSKFYELYEMESELFRLLSKFTPQEMEDYRIIINSLIKKK